MTNLDSILKKRHTLQVKVHTVKAMVFPVVMYGCESWTIKKAEHQRIDSFELWCWRRLLRVPWTARRSNQSLVKEISPYIQENHSWIFIGGTDAKVETVILWPPDAKGWLTGKVLDAGKDWGQEKKGMTEDEMVGWHDWLYGHAAMKICLSQVHTWIKRTDTSGTNARPLWPSVRVPSWWRRLVLFGPLVFMVTGKRSLVFSFFFLPSFIYLKYSWFTMVCYFLLYSRVTQFYIYTHSFPYYLHDGLSRDIEYSSLCPAVGFCGVSMDFGISFSS